MPTRSADSNRSGPVTTRVSQEAEDAVRLYLDRLHNPQPRPAPEDLVDVDAIRASTDDPLEAVKLVSKALSAAAVGEDPEVAFIRYAKTWAQHNGVSRDAFKTFGVKPSVLAKAFGDTTPPDRTHSGATRTPVNLEALAAGIRNKPEGTVVTIVGVIDEFGGSRATVRTMIDRLVSDSVLMNLGPDPDHHGPGRAPLLFVRV